MRQRETERLIPDLCMCIHMVVIGMGGDRETEREREVYESIQVRTYTERI